MGIRCVMSFLLSDKIPYFVTLLLSVLGWHLTQLIDEVRSTNAVTYEISSTADVYEVTIHNVSKKKSLIAAQFALSCPQLKHCIVPASANIVAYPPTFVPPTGLEGDRSFVMTTVTMGLGGKVGIKLKKAPGLAEPKLFFVPNSDKPIDIYMTDSGSLTGFVVTHYLGILIATFVLLLGLMGAALLHLRKPKLPGVDSNARGSSVKTKPK